MSFSFEIKHDSTNSSARVGTIFTPHGEIQTPAFIPVGTKASVKGVLPDSMAQLGAQAILANAYHLYLQPGADVIDDAGGLSKFMNWDKPTFTDSGGFQVMSLGAGFKKVIAMTEDLEQEEVVAHKKDRLAKVDEDGVTFKSHLDGSEHRFTPEISMQVQHQIGADIMFAFDELTTLMDTKSYQTKSLERTRLWAIRCLAEHARLTKLRSDKPYQALFGVIQGAQHEDLRRKAAKDFGAMEKDGTSFDGFGVGGAVDKNMMTQILTWVNEELPQDKPRHFLGIGEPEDLFIGVENGADTFDCVSASRQARTSSVYTNKGRLNVSNAPYKKDFSPIEESCRCYTCKNFTRAYLCHLFRAKEMVASTLATIHNEYFIINLVNQMREAILKNEFYELKTDFLGRYLGNRAV